MTDGFIPLEGNELHVIEVGHSDTDGTTVLHVPSLGLAVTGDVVYNGVHLYLVESKDGGRDAWRQALGTVESLHPRVVSTGHVRAHLDSDASRAINETRRYLDDVDELLFTQATPVEFFNSMVERYPEHANQSSLWGSALALYAERVRCAAALGRRPSAGVRER